MGTRVDFYVGRGEGAEWLGSYPFDGWPGGVFDDESHGEEMFVDPPPTEREWRDWVARFLAAGGERSTLPEDGWPWPWTDSQTTDYAYAWDDGVIYGANFGYEWFRVDPDADGWGQPTYDELQLPDQKSVTFPDMSARMALTYGPRSGLIVLGG